MARVALFLLLTFSSSVYATIDLNQLKSLVDSGLSSQAYEYAANEVTTYEGDPQFDYYYGIAAIDTGHASEGVFALDRVLLSDPDNHAARLELARGYFILEEYARARKEFETVLGVEPPADILDKIHAYLDAIRVQEGRYTTTQSAFIEIGYGSDSNVNSGPAITEYSVGTITVPLDTASQEQEDDFSRLTLNYRISTPVAPRTSYFAVLTGNVIGNSEHREFNTTTYTIDTGFEFLHAKDAYTISIIGQQFSLDGEEYRSLTGLNTNWRRRLSEQSSLQTFVQLAQQEFDGQETRDVDTLSLGTTYVNRFSVALSPVLFTGIYLAQDDPKLDSDVAKQSSERDYYGVRIGTILGLSAKTSTQLSVNYQTSEYGLEDSLTGQIREDDYLSTALDFTWLVTRYLSLSARANVSNNSSNNELYEYDRTEISLNLRYEMK